MHYINCSAYCFTAFRLPLTAIREKLLKEGANAGVKGTVYLAKEGININVCGVPEAVNLLQHQLKQFDELAHLQFKESVSGFIPFSKWMVKIRKELVGFLGESLSHPPSEESHIEAKALKALLDTGEDIQLIDARNTYETHIGSFEKAICLPLKTFRELPAALTETSLKKEKKTVIFCTGGIRCEKALAVFKAQGFEEVYQLSGGILQYFLECGDAHYHGDCFVFDDRVAVNPQLLPKFYPTCVSCQTVISTDARYCASCQPL